MRILDRYVTRQIAPVWIWCMVIFVFVSIVIDLFGHLEEVIRYRIPLQTVCQYYLNFSPLVFVRASPLALLLSCAFIATRLVRHQELLAMHASGTSVLRASVPFVFVGWVVSLIIFAVNEQVVPQTAATYERLRFEAFEGRRQHEALENVATIDRENRLYHARRFDPNTGELNDLTILEHDAQNHPKETLYASRGLFTRHGLLLLYGTIYRMGPRGLLTGEPQPFVERLVTFPVTPESLRQPETEPETMRYRQLRQLITRLKRTGITNVRRYAVELASKVTLPLMNIVVCLIAFAGSTRRYARGHLQGLGASLGWGVLYYVGVAISQGMGKEGVLPVVVSVWVPHLLALWLCWRALRPQPQHGV